MQSKASVVRYGAPLILLVALIGGLAWLGQYLPSWKKSPPPLSHGNKPLLEFSAIKINDVVCAQWAPGPPAPKEFEVGTKGHYDFPFKNTSEVDVELVHYTTTCDCASVRVGPLPSGEWERVDAELKSRPGDLPTYAIEPTWEKLARAEDATQARAEKAVLVVKPGEAGVVRVEWSANKAPGQKLEVQPIVWYQPVGDATQRARRMLAVPLTTVLPLQAYPVRASVGVLAAGAKGVAEFDVWSSTRTEFDLGLVLPFADPLFVVEVRPLRSGLFSRQELGALERRLRAKEINTSVRSAYHVTVTAHESRAQKQLDQGSFYRKFTIELNGRPETGMPGLEVVGRVTGDIKIGGFDDQGRIRFPSFNARTGADKTVELEADAKLGLEVYTLEPSWLEAKLIRTDETPTAGRAVWRLRVIVNPDTPGARSFDEPDAVVLRVKGTPERLLRIPIEGHVTGR